MLPGSYLSYSFHFTLFNHHMYNRSFVQLSYIQRLFSIHYKRMYCPEIGFVHLLLCIPSLVVGSRIPIFSVPFILVSIMRAVHSWITHGSHAKDQFLAMRNHQLFVRIQMGRQKNSDTCIYLSLD